MKIHSGLGKIVPRNQANPLDKKIASLYNCINELDRATEGAMLRQLDTRDRILNFIRGFAQENGYPPTVREIQRALDLASPRAVQYHLEALEGEGLIERVSHTVRGIHLPGREPVQEVPLFGTIAAGEPIAVPDTGGWVPVPEEMLQVPRRLVQGRREPFALRVKGISMIDALVDDGDIVILEPPGTVDNGEMVAVWLRDRQEVTLKRIYKEPGRVRLQPANREMEPIYADPDDVLVQGKVIAVLREYPAGHKLARQGNLSVTSNDNGGKTVAAVSNS